MSFLKRILSRSGGNASSNGALPSQRGSSSVTNEHNNKDNVPTSSQAAAASAPAATTGVSVTPPVPPPLPYGVKVWHDCPHATLDICFIHGLTGSRDSTWTAHGQAEPWPKLLLASRLPHARLLTYGYDADVVRAPSSSSSSSSSSAPPVAAQNRLSNHARNLLFDLTNDRDSCDALQRPIVFVVHSLGGLVCKQALLRSLIDPDARRKRLFAAAVGVLFLGTPHQGSWMARWAKIPVSALGFLRTTNESLLRILTRNDEFLESIQDNFFSLVRADRDNASRDGSPRRLDVACFFEEYPLPAIGKTVVNKDSATFPGYPLQSIPANHSDMVKFASVDDVGFVRVFHVLERWQKEVDSLRGRAETKKAEQAESTPGEMKNAEQAESLPAKPAPAYDAVPVSSKPADTVAERRPSHYSYLPLRRTKGFRFVGRTAEMALLQEKLFGHGDGESETESVALVGLGGIGKTQMAMQLTLWMKDNKPNYSVLWVPALSAAAFEKACTEILDEFRITPNKTEEKANETLRKHLSSEASGRWLLVVDNADDAEVVFGSDSTTGIYSSLPHSELGVILFTTRFRDIALRLAGVPQNILKVEKMPDEDAGSYLRQILDCELAADDAEAKRLLDRLACLPLAIKQAAYFMNRNSISLTRYLELLDGTEQDSIDLLSADFHDDTRYEESINAVAATWALSFNQLQDSDPTAAELLSFLSCVEPQGIPRSLLPALHSTIELEHAIGTLCGFAFLNRRGDSESFDMHRLVHLAVSSWLGKCGKVTETTTRAIQHVLSIFPKDIHQNRDIWRLYLPHALKLLHRSDDVFPKKGIKKRSSWRFTLTHPLRYLRGGGGDDGSVENNSALRLASIVGRCLLEDGRSKEAVEILEHVIAREERALRDDHPDRLASQYGLSGAYLYEGRVREAIAILEQIVARKHDTLFDELPRLLTSEHELAKTYLREGRTDDATATLDWVVAKRQELLAADDPDRIESQLELAGAYLQSGNIKKATALLNQVIAREKKIFRGRAGESVALRRKVGANSTAPASTSASTPALASASATSTPSTASAAASAAAYLDNGQLKETIVVLRYVASREKEMVAEEYPARLASQYQLTGRYIADGRAHEGVVILEHVIPRDAPLSPDHLAHLAAQRRAARLYMVDDDDDGDNGDSAPAAAAIAILEYVASRERTLPDGHPARLESQHDLAAAYLLAGRASEAGALLRHVVAVRQRNAPCGDNKNNNNDDNQQLAASQKLLSRANATTAAAAAATAR